MFYSFLYLVHEGIILYIWYTLSGDSSPCFCSTNCLCSGLSFLSWLYWEQPWKTPILSPLEQEKVCLQSWKISLLRKRQACIPPIIRDLSSLNSRFLSFHAIHCTHRYHSASFMSPCENCGLEKWHKNVDTPAAAIAMSDKLSFVSYPGISCLQPASLKLWHTNLLTCDWVKSQTLVTLCVLMYWVMFNTENIKRNWKMHFIPNSLENLILFYSSSRKHYEWSTTDTLYEFLQLCFYF